MHINRMMMPPDIANLADSFVITYERPSVLLKPTNISSTASIDPAAPKPQDMQHINKSFVRI